MMKYNLYLISLFFMLISVSTCAQQTAGLTLAQAWELAYQNYAGLMAKDAQLQEAYYAKKEVQSRSLPQIQLQLQNSYGTFAGSNGAFFPVPGVFNVNGTKSDHAGSPAANTFGSVLADWKFFEFGRQRKTIAAAGYKVQEAQSGYDAAKLSLQAKVTSLYIGILYANSNLTWADQQVKRVKEILELTVSLADAGLKPGADTALAASSYLLAVASKNEWAGKYNAGQINFSEVVPGTSVLLPQQSFMHYQTLHILPDSISSNHPYLQILDQQVRYNEVQNTLASKKAFPSLSLLGGLSARGSGIYTAGTVEKNWSAGFNNIAHNYLIGIGLTWNLSNIYTGSPEKKRTAKTLQSSKFNYDLQKLQMNTAIQAINSRTDQQLKQVKNTRLALAKAQQAYELYLSRYESGLINLTELLQIQSLLQQVEKNSIEVQQEFWNLLIRRAELSGDFNYLFNQF
ncbi:outer membrane protein TolC [Pedobacter cryoconitis]|uniref:TolC family protein n=1 Tax=Pedobacter cryoconitis TaxID=188932 RepID=UPI0016103C95|nr:TolC family protein [Pedobacter cryoconitis]MBB6269753.1 outer membrane protein TolC [Pedobacter cryoconitis]